MHSAIDAPTRAAVGLRQTGAQHAERIASRSNALPDARHIAVAQETGYGPHEVLSRGIAFCRANPRLTTPDFDFDQAADRHFDRTMADCRKAVSEIEAEARREVDPFRVIDARGLEDRLASARTQASARPKSRVVALTVRIDQAEGGFSVVARVDGSELFRTPVLDETRATREEPRLRAALFAYAAELQREAA